MSSKLFKIIKFLVGWPISILAILFIIRLIQSKYSSVNLSFNSINIPVVIISIVFFQLYFFLRAFFWHELIRAKGHKLPFKDVLFLWEFAELKRYVPGNIWAFVGRTFSFNDKGIEKKEVMHFLFLESGFFIFSSFLVSLMSLVYVFNILPDFSNEFFLQPLIFFVILVGTLFFILNKSIREKLGFNKNRYLNFILPNFSFTTNLRLLSIIFLSVFSFGAGTYFAINSIFFIGISEMYPLIGFSVLSLVLGYLSIITPLGLGVREGILTYGLSAKLSIAAAGISAIFARALLIVSEIIFFTITLLIKNTKSKFIIKIEDFVRLKKHEVILGISVIIYSIYFNVASFLKYDNFYMGRFDLGNMVQAVWNTTNGRIFEVTDANGISTASRLSGHADFILVLISPFYWVWQNPKMLLFLQTIILSLGAIFVYLIAKNVLKNKNISLILALAYLLNPALEFTNLYDFHAVTFATTFLLAAFYFLLKDKYRYLLFFLILAGLCKENIWLINAFFGIYILVFKKKKILGSGIFLSSLFIFFYLFLIAIPNASNIGKHFILSYYSDFGTSPQEVLKNIILNPVKIFNTLTGSSQLLYIKQLFFPLGLLSIFSPFIIFLLPELFLILLGNNTQLHEIYYQYSATITPFIFISAIFAIKNINKVFPKLSLNMFSAYVIIFTFFCAYFFGPLPFAKYPDITVFTNRFSYEDTIDNYLNSIPKKYSVTATNNLGSHLSERRVISTIPVGLGKTDYVLFLIRQPFDEDYKLQDYKTLKQVSVDKNYIKVFEKGEFVVFQKKGL